MNAIRLTIRRTISQAHHFYSMAFLVGSFLAVVAACFAYALDSYEGMRMAVSTIWSSAVSPVLPFLAAFLGMDVWCEERRTGRLEMLLTTPVSVVELTLGKFFGVWLMMLGVLLLSLVPTLLVLHLYAPDCFVSALSMISAFVALSLQGALWCGVSVAASALFSRPALAAAMSLLLTMALPRGIWHGLVKWSVLERSMYGEMPLDAHVVDMTSGLFSSATVLSYLLLTVLALLLSVIFIESTRLVGRGGRRVRMTGYCVAVLASVFSFLSILLLVRTDITFFAPVADTSLYSARTLSVLSEVRGEIYVTGFMSRADARFRPLARSLRALSRVAASAGSTRIVLRFVDPSWDIGEASRLVRAGVHPGSVVFTYGRRRAELPVDGDFGERVLASTILRLTKPPQRCHVRWTSGHGESAFDDYGPFGMSDIARELMRDGYRNARIDLSSDAPIPSDCALIVIAGARDEFSRSERARLDAYLKQGGRLLVLMNAGEVGGISTLLSGWGVKPSDVAKVERTVSGRDALVTAFADHPVVAPLKGLSILMDRPLSFLPSAAVESALSVDRIAYTALAKIGDNCVSALVERGAGLGRDLDLRPVRIIVVGDSSFVMNAQLLSQAHANRDFFLNAVAYLAGTDAMTSGGLDRDVLLTGMDRVLRRHFLIALAVVAPVVVVLILLLNTFIRRHRK